MKAVALSELQRLVSPMRPEAGGLGPYDPRQPQAGSLTRAMGHKSVLGIVAVLVVASAHAASGAAKPGRWIVFSAFPNGVPPAQLFRVQVTNEGLQQITHSKDTTTQPAFSPNGKRVVFARLGSGITSPRL